MRRRRFVAALGVGALCVSALIAQDVLATLGVRPDQARTVLFEILDSGRPGHEVGKMVFLNATADARAALVTGAFSWAKEYTQSPEFATRYATVRTQAEPRPSMGRKWSAEEELTRRQGLLDQRIAAAKKQLDAPPSPRQTPERQEAERKASEQRIKSMEADRLRYDDPVARAEMRKPLEAEDQWYKERHARWEETYPADVRAAIARRLRDFLALSATVDFNAKLVPCRNPQHSCFVDPTYEKKPEDWKRCFRAGKQSVEAARAFVTSWLRELEKKTS